MAEVKSAHLFSADNILGISEHRTMDKILVTTNDSVSLVNVSNSQSERTWSQPKESLKFTAPAVQYDTSLFAVLSHKTFIQWKIEGDLSTARKSTSEFAVAQLHSSLLLQGHIMVVFCDASISLLSAADLKIVLHNHPPSSAQFQFEFSRVVQTKEGDLLLFVLAKNEEKYFVFGYNIDPVNLSIGLTYSFEVPHSPSAIITSCSFDQRGFGVQWSTGFWERYTIKNEHFALTKSLSIATPTILPNKKGKQKLDQVDNTTTALDTHAFVYPSTLITLTTKKGGPTLTVWSTLLNFIPFEQKLPVSKSVSNNIKQLYRSHHDARRFFMVLEKEVIRSEINLTEVTLCDAIGKAPQVAHKKPTLSTFISFDDYLDRENERVVGDGTVELEIADTWKEGIEKESLVEEKSLSSLMSSERESESNEKITEYITKIRQRGLHPSYNYLTTALTHCIKKGFWVPVNSLLLSNLVTRQMAPGLIAQIIENKNMSLIRSVINHMKNLSSKDVISILKFVLSPNNIALIKEYVNKVYNGGSKQPSLYFVLDDLITIPLQSIVEIDNLTQDEITILLSYFQSRFNLYFKQLSFTPETAPQRRTHKHTQPLWCILFWLSEMFDSKFMNLLATQESYSLIESIQKTLSNQVAIGQGLAVLNGVLLQIKASITGGTKILQLSRSLYTIETWPNPRK